MNIHIITSGVFDFIDKNDKSELERIKQTYENSNIIFDYYISDAWCMPVFSLKITDTDENNFTVYTYDREERTHTIKKEKITSIIELIKQYKDIFSSEDYCIEYSNCLDGYNYTIALSDKENLYYFRCDNIGSYAPNVRHLIELIDSILGKFNIKDEYKPYKYFS